MQQAVDHHHHHGPPLADDLGYVQQSPDEAEVLFTLLAECYEDGIRAVGLYGSRPGPENYQRRRAVVAARANGRRCGRGSSAPGYRASAVSTSSNPSVFCD